MAQIRKLYHAEPFRPFVLHLDDGRDFMVKSPMSIALSPTDRTVAVAVSEDALGIVDVESITGIEVLDERSASRPKARK